MNFETKVSAKKDTHSIPYLKIILCLFFICTVCSALLGTTFLLTKEPIAQNEAETIRNRLVSIFGENATFESDIPIPQGQKAVAVYRARGANDDLLGYAVRVLSPGFSDDIDMIVGFNADSTVRKIEIIAMSETAGLGTRVAEAEHLSQYEGKTGELKLKDDIDAISGATKSSRAVLNGVNAATACLSALGI